VPQCRGDLGRRLLAASEVLLRRAPRVILLAADNPTLPPACLREALAALERDDVVLGPTEDGGYYLIGLRQPVAGLFSGIPWSTGETARATAAAAQRLGLRLHQLPQWYDLDVPADLRRLEKPSDPAVGPHGLEPWPARHVRAVLKAASEAVA
jgi:glycosyltransferase A (GT-A) superfamily protein (DUF2064 family)